MKVTKPVIGLGGVLIAVLGLFSGAGGIDRDGNFFALGVGSRSCDDFLRLQEGRLDLTSEQYRIADYAVEQWLAGFLTAHNLYVADTYNVKGNSTMRELEEQLERHCRKRPTQYFAEAVISLIRELHPYREKNEPTRIREERGRR